MWSLCSCAGMQHAAATGKMLEEILAGCTNPDPAQHGMTTEEERAASNVQVGHRATAGCQVGWLGHLQHIAHTHVCLRATLSTA